MAIALLIVSEKLAKSEDNVKLQYNQGYLNGTIDTQIAINNQIVYGLATYNEYRGNVFYQNQSIPIRCEVVRQ